MFDIPLSKYRNCAFGEQTSRWKIRCCDETKTPTKRLISLSALRQSPPNAGAHARSQGGPVNCGLTTPTLPVTIERALKSAIACSCVSSQGCDRDRNRMSLWNLKFREWFVAAIRLSL
jgi:hypothetical protein